MKQEKQYRQDIINAGMKMNELGINQGTSGNISLRWEDGILITQKFLMKNSIPMISAGSI
jgi:L-fuculose-phosphate aldolase